MEVIVKLPIIILSLLFCVTQQSFGMSFDLLEKTLTHRVKPYRVPVALALECDMLRPQIDKQAKLSTVTVYNSSHFPENQNSGAIAVPDNLSPMVLSNVLNCIKEPKKILQLPQDQIVALFKAANQIGAPEKVLRKFARRLSSTSPFNSEDDKQELLAVKKIVLKHLIQKQLNKNKLRYTMEIDGIDGLLHFTNQSEEIAHISFDFDDFELTKFAKDHQNKITTLKITNAILSGLNKSNMDGLKRKFPNVCKIIFNKSHIKKLSPDFLSDSSNLTLILSRNGLDSVQLRALQTFEENKQKSILKKISHHLRYNKLSIGIALGTTISLLLGIDHSRIFYRSGETRLSGLALAVASASCFGFSCDIYKNFKNKILP